MTNLSIFHQMAYYSLFTPGLNNENDLKCLWDSQITSNYQWSESSINRMRGQIQWMGHNPRISIYGIMWNKRCFFRGSFMCTLSDFNLRIYHYDWFVVMRLVFAIESGIMIIVGFRFLMYVIGVCYELYCELLWFFVDEFWRVWLYICPVSHNSLLIT